jgi:protein CpxP
MKKLFIAATALLLGTATLHAQTKTETADNTTKQQHKGFRGHHRGGMQHLNLNDDQKKQFKDLGQNYHKQITDLRNDKSLSADELKSKTAALRKEQHQKMQSLLTPEQKTQMASQRKNKSQAMQNGGKRFDKMKAKLGLTDEQAAKLKTSQAGFHEKIKAIKTNSALSDSQKKDQVKALAKQHREDMKSVLTAEQIEKMKAGRRTKNNAGSIK